jgi:hypothetical protein
MLPARYPGFGPATRGGPAVRTVITIAAAALIGTLVGGLSVLGVVVAVVQPRNVELRGDTGKADTGKNVAGVPGAAVSSGIPGQVEAQRQSVPPANAPVTTGTVAPANAPAAAAIANPPAAAVASNPPAAPNGPPNPASPTQPQPAASLPASPASSAQPAQALPAQPQNAERQPITWPDALTRRTAQDREHAPEKSDQTAYPQTSPAQSAAAPGKDQNVVNRHDGDRDDAERSGSDRRDLHKDADKSQPAADNRAVASRGPTTVRVSPFDLPGAKTPSGSRRAAKRPRSEPAPPPEPRDTVAEEPPPASAPPAQRSLFDFFGGGHYSEDRRVLDEGDASGPAENVSRSSAAPEIRDSRSGTRRVVRQPRRDEPEETIRVIPAGPEQDRAGFFGGWHSDHWSDDN